MGKETDTKHQKVGMHSCFLSIELVLTAHLPGLFLLLLTYAMENLQYIFVLILLNSIFVCQIIQIFPPNILL